MLNLRTGRLLALSSLVICAQAKGRGGGGGGGSGGGSSINLGIGGKDMALFVTSIIFALLFFSQLIRSFKIFSNRSVEEEIPLRKPFGALILGATTSLTAFYALRAVTATSTSYRWSNFPNALWVVLLVVSKLVDIFCAAAVFLMVNHRRNAYLAETTLYEMSGKQRVVYTTLPIIYLVVMVVTAAVAIGMYARLLLDYSFSPTTTFLKGYDATQHLFLAAYLLLVITIVTSAIRLWCQIKRQPSHSYPFNDTNVFGRVAKVMCTALAILALFSLIVHIIVYLPTSGGFLVYDRFALGISDLIINGILWLVLTGTAINLGRLPKDAKKAGGAETVEA